MSRGDSKNYNRLLLRGPTCAILLAFAYSLANAQAPSAKELGEQLRTAGYNLGGLAEGLTDSLSRPLTSAGIKLSFIAASMEAIAANEAAISDPLAAQLRRFLLHATQLASLFRERGLLEIDDFEAAARVLDRSLSLMVLRNREQSATVHSVSFGSTRLSGVFDSLAEQVTIIGTGFLPAHRNAVLYVPGRRDSIAQLKVTAASDSILIAELIPRQFSSIIGSCGSLVIGGRDLAGPSYPVCFPNRRRVVVSPELIVRYERVDSVVSALEAREVRLESNACGDSREFHHSLKWTVRPGSRLVGVETQTLEARGFSSIRTSIVDDSAAFVSVSVLLLPSRCVSTVSGFRVLYSSMWYGLVRPLATQHTFVSEFVSSLLPPVSQTLQTSSAGCAIVPTDAELREIQISLRAATDKGALIAQLNMKTPATRLEGHASLAGYSVIWQSLTRPTTRDICAAIEPFGGTTASPGS